MLVGKTHTMTKDDIIAQRVADRLLDISSSERAIRDLIGEAGYQAVLKSPLWTLEIIGLIQEAQRLANLGIKQKRIIIQLRKHWPHPTETVAGRSKRSKSNITPSNPYPPIGKNHTQKS